MGFLAALDFLLGGAEDFGAADAADAAAELGDGEPAGARVQVGVVGDEGGGEVGDGGGTLLAERGAPGLERGLLGL